MCEIIIDVRILDKEEGGPMDRPAIQTILVALILAAGCDDVVTKPVAPEKLLAAIRAHLPATSRA